MSRIFIVIFAVISFFLFNVKTQCVELKIIYYPGEKYSLTIRSDFSIYLNNKYQGLNSKVVKYIFTVDNGSSIRTASGELYNLDKTIKNGINTGYIIDNISQCEFSFGQNGKVVKFGDNYKFPLISGVPFFPEKNMLQGDIVDSTGDAVFDIAKDINNVQIPIFCQTLYAGKKNIFSKDYEYFQIKYGYSRMKSDVLSNSTSMHNVDFYFDSKEYFPVYLEDHFTEEFTTVKGDKIRRSGFHLYFYSKITVLDRDDIINVFKEKSKDIGKNKANDLTFEKRDEGVAIIINNLKFKPDSTELLDEEKEKLLPLYDMLSGIKNRTFKIVGHTAKSGSENEQLALSMERAKTIAMFLIGKGINPLRIMYTGEGAAFPIAPNDSEENMQKNRRVEIVIMED